jgi:hypothetical protein
MMDAIEKEQVEEERARRSEHVRCAQVALDASRKAKQAGIFTAEEAECLLISVEETLIRAKEASIAFSNSQPGPHDFGPDYDHTD